MRHAPSATSLPGTRLLAFARLWFSPAIVAGVFEPLVADWQGESRVSDSPFWTNLRWRISFLTNGVAALPRLLAVQTPPAVMFDVLVRAVVFGALGFSLQQAFGRRGYIEGVAVIDSLPFALLPVVIRLQRSTELPRYAARALALRWTIASAILLAVVASQSWPARLGAATMPLIVAFMGWRLSDARSREWPKYNLLVKSWLTIAMLASTWMLAAYPIRLALGIRLLDRFWGTDVQYLLAILLAGLLHIDEWRDRRRHAR